MQLELRYIEIHTYVKWRILEFFEKINNFPTKEHRQTPKHTGKLKTFSQQCVSKKNYQGLEKRPKISQKFISQMSVINEIDEYISVIFMNVI